MKESTSNFKLPKVNKSVRQGSSFEPTKLKLESKSSVKNIHSKGVPNVKKGSAQVSITGQRITLPGLNTVSSGFHVSAYGGLKLQKQSSKQMMADTAAKFANAGAQTFAVPDTANFGSLSDELS